MADFRRCIFAFAVPALVAGLVPTASAQTPFSCIASANQSNIRTEGLTELVGDILLSCTGGTPTAVGTPIPTANLTVFLNTNVTSRLLGTAGVSNASEALLLIDDPNRPTNPSPLLACGSPSGAACPVAGTGGGVGAGGPFNGTAGRFNVFQGTVSGSNSVTFSGVPIDAPGTTLTPRIFRIVNIRVAAPSLAGLAGSTLVTALIATSGNASVPITNNPSQIVGVVLPGLTFSVRNSAGDVAGKGDITRQQCVTLDRKDTSRSGILRFREGFNEAFKTRTAAAFAGTETSPAPVVQNVPGESFLTETGFFDTNPAATPAGAGLADFGTRLKAVFNNIPSGVSVFVGITNTNLLDGTRVARLVGSEVGAFFPVPPLSSESVAQLPVVNNSATAVWEVLGADPNVQQSFDFGFSFGFTANPASNSPATGTATVNGSFAPTPPAFSATDGRLAQGASFPIPRFKEPDATAATNVLIIVQCRTDLLFPFVTNQVGFDTGLAISNTSQDPFGTSTQAGTCTLNFFGANAPAAITTASVAAGTTFTTLASTSAPNFQGYMIAVCNFQYAHGFAFVSDLGARNLAMGYLALVIPDPPRSASPASLGGSGSGENLSQ